MRGHLEVVRLLLDRVGDINHQGENAIIDTVGSEAGQLYRCVIPFCSTCVLVLAESRSFLQSYVMTCDPVSSLLAAH